jgi:hypothetical protein
VHHAGRVRDGKAAGHLRHDVEYLLRWQRARGDELGERRAVDELHHDEGGLLRAGFAEVVHLSDGRVRQAGGVAGLRPEARDGPTMLGELGAQQLHGNRTVKDEVHGAPDSTHAARGNQPLHLVAGGEYLGTEGEGHPGQATPFPSDHPASPAVAVGGSTG